MPHPENPQMDERWIWAVQYDDGSFQQEYPDPKTHNSFAQMVDIERVRELDIIPNHWLGLDGPSYVIPCPPGTRPIFFRQNAIELDQNTGAQVDHCRYTVIGYQRGELDGNGRNVQHLTYLPESTPEAAVVLSPYRLQIG